MKTIIVDDELVSIEILKKAAEQVSEIEIIGSFTTAMHAIKFMNKNHVDLIQAFAFFFSSRNIYNSQSFNNHLNLFNTGISAIRR